MVLVIDDDRDSCEALADFLAFKGYGVQCVNNGNDAFLFVDRTHNRPTLIFLDLVMPILDGWGFLAERVKYPLLADVPVVILSACSDVVQRAKEAGAVAVMRKPAEPQRLLQVIEHFSQRI
ncbi:MAG: response regulator [Deltaproteobacteria bacterium]|nr:response regulator [Deltaproteobacteria bacterium]